MSAFSLHAVYGCACGISAFSAAIAALLEVCLVVVAVHVTVKSVQNKEDNGD